MSSRTRRIAKELADIEADSTSNLTAQPADQSGDLTHLKACITGPPGTPYEGGSFIVDVKIPTEYPFRPPLMRFETNVWHPNISSQTVRPPPLAACPMPIPADCALTSAAGSHMS